MRRHTIRTSLKAELDSPSTSPSPRIRVGLDPDTRVCRGVPC